MSNAATHGPGVRSQRARLAKLSWVSTRTNRTAPAAASPSATVIGLRRVGRLVKSMPATAWKSGEVGVIVTATVRAPTLPRKTPMADATPAASPAPTPAAAPLQERLVTTEHKHKLGKRMLDYRVTCGTLMLREDEGNKDGQRSADKPRAALFFI